MTERDRLLPTHLIRPLLLLTTLVVFSGLRAEVFLPKLYLEGYYPVVENKVDYYKYHRGLRVTSLRSYFIEAFQQRTVVIVVQNEERILLTPAFGNHMLARPRVMTFQEYLLGSTRAKFHQLLRKNVYEVLQDDERDSGSGIFREFEIELPRQAIPKAFRRVLGTSARLSIDGSQKLTFAGSSTTRENAGQNESGAEQDFDLEMRQELRLQLKGTIGDKIHVNVNHTSISEEQLSNPNEIEIKYVGVEDEIVQEIEAGNISLSLPSTTYVGYSASSESLFGVKSRMKVGYLELTTIVGKEEGQKTSKSLTGSSESDSVTIRSYQYAPRTYYYIDDPYELYDIIDTPSTDQPPSWAGNAIRTEAGDWVIANPMLLPEAGTVRVFLDDDSASNDQIFTIPGHAIDPANGDGYSFEELIEGTDFVVNYDLGWIYINRTIPWAYSIGVIYTKKSGETVGTPSTTDLEVKMLRVGDQGLDSPTWNLQMRNIYKLPMENVQNDGFSFVVYTENTDDTRNYNVPDSITTGTVGETYVDYLRLDTNNDGQLNGDDDTIDLTGGYVIMPFVEPFDAFLDSKIYDKEYDRVSTDEWSVYMVAKGDIGRDQISLNQMNILKGSVRITVDGRTLKENVDYIVDYDFGTVTFLTSEGKNPDAQINIDFEYKPLFAIESKTMAGIRAEMQFNDNTRLGGTFIYHSEKVADERPKIGNENRTQILADLDGEISFDPPFMTKLVDLLPFVRTDEDSRLSLAGEVALNLPTIYGNPDKKDDPEAYLEDMESILSVFPLGVMRSGWAPGSEPYGVTMSRADVKWWNPQDVYARDVYEDSLLTEDEQDERVSLLRVKLTPTSLQIPGVETHAWGGLMKYIGNRLDFSEKKYIEVMVRVDTTKTDYDGSVVMHIDMGDINEDFYTEFGGLGVLNTEDGKNGGEADGIYDWEEDVGLDGIPNNEPGDDPEDDFSADKVGGEYPRINGTEGNKQLDSEDLDSNGSLDTANRYFDYTLNVTGSQYLESANSRGYRIYRIPLLEEMSYDEVSSASTGPEHDEISYVRVWFDVTDTTYIDLVNVDVVGNKWEDEPIREVGSFFNDTVVSDDVLDAHNESMQVGITDNIDNTHYTAPPETTDKEDGVETLEQSLVLDYKNLYPGHYGMVRQTLLDGYSLLSYNKVRFFAYPEIEEGEVYPDSIELVFRLCSDSLNYYEIGVKLEPYPYDNNPNLGSSKMPRNSWYDFEIDFTQLTQLKVENDDPYIVVADTVDNITYRRVKNPTLSNIEEMQLGLRIPNSSQPFSGRIYYNDIRVADPYDDPGYAARTTLNAKFADFMTFDATLAWKTPNFYTVTSRGTNTSQVETVDLTLNNRVQLQKFFPAEWGLKLPLSLGWQQTESTPRFKANSDILVEDLDGEEKDRQVTRTQVRTASLNFSQTRTPDNWILAYTVKNTSLSGDVRQSFSEGPTQVDTTLTYTEGLTYNLDVPQEKTGFTLWGDYKAYFLPQQYRNTYTFKASYPRRWNWTKQTDGEYEWVFASQTVNTRTLDTTNKITYDILSDLTADYTLKTKRNLMWRDYWMDINIGREKTREQNWDFDYSPNWIDDYVAWDAHLGISYDQTQKEVITTGTSGEEVSSFTFTGGMDRNFDVDVVLKNRDMLNDLVERLGGETVDFRSGPKFDPPKPMNDDEKKDDEEYLDGDRGEPPVLPPDEQLPGDDEKPPIGDLTPLVGDSPLDPELPEDKKPEDPERRKAEGDGEGEKEGEGEKKAPAEPEGARFNPLVTILEYVARLENIQCGYTNNYSTNFDEREDAPDFLYQISIPHILVGDDISLKKNNDTFTASTGLPILNNLSTRWSYAYEITRSYSSTTTQSITQTFPNVTATLTGFENLIGMEEMLSNSSLSSSYVLMRKETGVIDWDEPTTTVLSSTFNPLLGWTGKWSFNLDTGVSYSTNSSWNIQHREGDDIERLTTERRINTNFVHRLSAAQGIKLPFLKRWILKNEFTTTLDITYEKKQTTLDSGSSKQTELDNVSYKVRLSGSYDFHRNVEGGSQITYDWSHDIKRDVKVKTFGLSVWVKILF